MFWCIQRVTDRNKANLFLEYCTVRANQLSVNLPDGVKELKMPNGKMPKVPVLVNKKDVPGDTLLLALEDPIIAKAKEDEKGADDKPGKKAKHD